MRCAVFDVDMLVLLKNRFSLIFSFNIVHFKNDEKLGNHVFIRSNKMTLKRVMFRSALFSAAEVLWLCFYLRVLHVHLRCQNKSHEFLAT